jgi:UDP-glucose 4-epimerase
MKVLILGGSGFIGTHLAEFFLEKRYDVLVVDLKKPRLDVAFKKMSILDESIERIVQDGNFDAIINLVALKRVSEENYYDALQYNSIGAAKIFQIAKEFKIPILHVSSTAVYGEFSKVPADEGHPLNPISHYGFSKFLGEKIGLEIMKDAESRFVIFRPTIVYGPNGDDVVTTFIVNSLSGKPLTIFNKGECKRDFLYVKDLVRAINLAIENKACGIFNIGTGTETTIAEVASIVKKLSPDAKIIDVKNDKKEVNQGALDISKAKRELSYEPKYYLEMGIKETIQYYSNSMQRVLDLS